MRWQVMVGLLTTAVVAGCLVPGTVEAPPKDASVVYHHPEAWPDVIVEIDHASSTAPPDEGAVAHLRATLADVLPKRSVEVVQRAYPSPATERLAEEKQWDSASLRQLASELIDHAPYGAFGNGTRAVIHVVYVAGEYAEDGNALGLATESTAFLFRSDRSPVERPSLVPSSGELIERAVLTHEVGHLLGLVNRDLPMVQPHEDPNHPRHSTNPESVMYHAVDAFDAIVGMVEQGRAPPDTFDPDDLADMAAYQANLRTR